MGGDTKDLVLSASIHVICGSISFVAPNGRLGKRDKKHAVLRSVAKLALPLHELEAGSLRWICPTGATTDSQKLYTDKTTRRNRARLAGATTGG